jgi:CheY-like chemotaxis protein
MARLLRRRGYAVTAAHSIAEALRADLSECDLVVSDIGLPDGNGCDLMRQLRARRELPGIALSGYGRDEDLARSRAAGFRVHLTKPVDLPRLEAAIREVVGSA